MHFTTAEKPTNLGRKGANKAQERAQTLAHGHPWDLGCFLIVVSVEPECSEVINGPNLGGFLGLAPYL